MKDANYKHRRLVAMSTTGKLSPIPPTPPSEVTQLPEAKASPVLRPRIAPYQPAVSSPVAEGSIGASIRKFLRALFGKKTEGS